MPSLNQSKKWFYHSYTLTLFMFFIRTDFLSGWFRPYLSNVWYRHIHISFFFNFGFFHLFRSHFLFFERHTCVRLKLRTKRINRPALPACYCTIVSFVCKNNNSGIIFSSSENLIYGTWVLGWMAHGTVCNESAIGRFFFICTCVCVQYVVYFY